MKQRYFYLTAILTAILISAGFPVGLDDLLTKKLTIDRIKYFPVTPDNINYIFLQSIENDSVIVIGDFSGLEKMIVMIIDKNGDNTIDAVLEYYPLTRDLKRKTSSKSKFFNNDIAKLKRDIIEGTVYKGNYTDNI